MTARVRGDTAGQEEVSLDTGRASGAFGPRPRVCADLDTPADLDRRCFRRLGQALFQASFQQIAV